jgi:hypothetical protein
MDVLLLVRPARRGGGRHDLLHPMTARPAVVRPGGHAPGSGTPCGHAPDDGCARRPRARRRCALAAAPGGHAPDSGAHRRSRPVAVRLGSRDSVARRSRARRRRCATMAVHLDGPAPAAVRPGDWCPAPSPSRR